MSIIQLFRPRQTVKAWLFLGQSACMPSQWKCRLSDRAGLYHLQSPEGIWITDVRAGDWLVQCNERSWLPMLRTAFESEYVVAEEDITPRIANHACISLDTLERMAILDTLKATNGNREQAASLLGIGSRTLYRKLRDYELDKEE
jgi:hypothetical protein